MGQHCGSGMTDEMELTNMRLGQRRSQRLEHELRDRISRRGELAHEYTPLCCVPLLCPILIRVRVGRVEHGFLEWDHLRTELARGLGTAARHARRTFWKMKWRAPDLYRVVIQLTAHAVVSTTVTPGAPPPVRSASRPTSLVPIQSVNMVSSMLRRREPFFSSAKNVGSWLSNTEGAGREVILFEHVAPDFANGNNLKPPS